MTAHRPPDCGGSDSLTACDVTLLHCTVHSDLQVRNICGHADVQVLHEWRGSVIPSSVSSISICHDLVMCSYLPNELGHTADEVDC